MDGWMDGSYFLTTVFWLSFLCPKEKVRLGKRGRERKRESTGEINLPINCYVYSLHVCDAFFRYRL